MAFFTTTLHTVRYTMRNPYNGEVLCRLQDMTPERVMQLVENHPGMLHVEVDSGRPRRVHGVLLRTGRPLVKSEWGPVHQASYPEDRWDNGTRDLIAAF